MIGGGDKQCKCVSVTMLIGGVVTATNINLTHLILYVVIIFFHGARGMVEVMPTACNDDDDIWI